MTAPMRAKIGSSPRVWGTRPNDARFRCSDRFIPTCVGNSDIYPAARRQFPVHPHVCGELYRIYRSPGNQPGSSPRVWGTQSEPIAMTDVDRFIPTCVGNSSFESCSADRGRFIPTCVGNSSFESCSADRGRFIPTCVGNSKSRSHRTCDRSVHPHVCGELGTFQNPGNPFFGSSPRVWGTLFMFYMKTRKFTSEL